MDPWSGRVIALVNPSEALFRAYQPCSVFKIVVAIAGLSEGVITPETTYTCDKGCWMWPGHGPIDLRRALAVSCNPYFQWVGEQLGYERMQRYAHLLGLGSAAGSTSRARPRASSRQRAPGRPWPTSRATPKGSRRRRFSSGCCSRP